MLVFLVLGVIFGVSYFLIRVLEHIVAKNVFTFFADLFLLISWGFAFSSAMIAYNNGSVRAYIIIPTAVGIFLSCLALHKPLRHFYRK